MLPWMFDFKGQSTEYEYDDIGRVEKAEEGWKLEAGSWKSPGPIRGMCGIGW
jgi:hypothetical protein